MNKRIDLTNLGGFPFTQASLDFMQSSYREAFKGIAKLCGDKTIITGVVNTAGVLSDGWISYNGELIPFVGGAATAGVVVQETATQVQFQDNVNRDAYFTKVAFCGSPQTFAFADLRRLNTLNQMWLPGDMKMVQVTMAYIAANFDSTGLGINERLGWKVANGQNGTINMSDQLPLGYNWANIVTETEIVGTAKGSKKIALGQLPKHTPAGMVLNPWSGDSTGLGDRDAGDDSTTSARNTARKVYKQGLIGNDEDYFPASIITLYLVKI